MHWVEELDAFLYKYLFCIVLCSASEHIEFKYVHTDAYECICMDELYF